MQSQTHCRSPEAKGYFYLSPSLSPHAGDVGTSPGLCRQIFTLPHKKGRGGGNHTRLSPAARLPPCFLHTWLHLGLSPCILSVPAAGCGPGADVPDTLRPAAACTATQLCCTVALCHHTAPALSPVSVTPGFCNRAFVPESES